MNVLLLGNNGMLGHAVEKILRSNTSLKIKTTSRNGVGSDYAFNAATEAPGKILDTFLPDYIVNCIGIIKPRINDENAVQREEAVRVNSSFPFLLNNIAANSRIIQIATDCVYSGKLGNYDERSEHDALDVYGKTKSLGEVPSDQMMHIRASIIGPEQGRSTSLLEWFLNQPSGSKLNGYGNHLWNGVTTFQFGEIVDGIISKNRFRAGVQHLVPSDIVSKYNLLRIFQNTYNRLDLEISEVHPPQIIDRTLTTIDGHFNSELWNSAGYSSAPTIAEMVARMSEYKSNES
jgi:dTDP-4-dehydrorhamnose reductase